MEYVIFNKTKSKKGEYNRYHRDILDLVFIGTFYCHHRL